MSATSNKRVSNYLFRTLVLVAALAGLSTGERAAADLFVSARPGAWTDATMWITTSPSDSPGENDDVVIVTGHTVGLVEAGAAALPQVTVASLTVMPGATLQPQYSTFGDPTDGRNMAIHTTRQFDFAGLDPNDFPHTPDDIPLDPNAFDPNTPMVPLMNFGTIQGEDGGAIGGSVLISTIWDPNSLPFPGATPGLFENQGEIRGGSAASFGGNVLVFYADGWAFNLGTVAGGDGGRNAGFATVYGGEQARNIYWDGDYPGQVLGGYSDGGSGGPAFLIGVHSDPLAAVTAANDPNSAIVAGDGSIMEDDTHRGGGDAGLLALSNVDGSNAENWDDARIVGGYGCPGGTAWLFGRYTLNRGTVSDGGTECEPPPPVIVEPPDGLIEGPAEITGHTIHFAGGTSMTFALDAKSPGDPAPIRAEGDIVITVGAEGTGVVDFSGLDASGGTYIQAGGSITIEADMIIWPDNPGNILDPMPDPEPLDPLPYRLLYSGEDAEYCAEAGEELEMYTVIANLGNVAEPAVRYTVDDSAGWVSPVDTLTSLDSIDGLGEQIVVNVPEDAESGDETVISVEVWAVTDPDVRALAEITVRLPCPGDVDRDNDTDLADLAALLGSYGTCDGDPGYNPAADLDQSGCIDLSDLAILLSDYGCGI